MASTPFRRLCHWGPISVLGIIKLITWAMVHLLGMWWPPHQSLAAALHAGLFLSLAGATLYFFLQSLLEGPGFVPLGWKPEHEEDTYHLQFCTVCNGFKAPRSHHCRKCGHCVKKMDHHCPWINCCVGHNNHGYFTLFLVSGVLGCLHASIVLSICIYHAINRIWYIHNGTGREPMIYLTLTTLMLTLLAIGMAVGVVLAVGALLYIQIRGILRNQTTIEDWIVEKAVSRREELGLPEFVFPYNVGWKNNLKLLVYGAQYDGIKWPVREGCEEYDLTREQQAQKQDKRVRSRVYTAVQQYSGRWLPVCAWPRAALAAPCSDEPRLPLQPGDMIRATRQRRHWLFGEKLVGGGEGRRGPRGWFPRDAAVPYEWAGPAKPCERAGPAKPCEWAEPAKPCEPGAPCQWAEPAMPYEWAGPAKPCEPGAPCQWTGPAKPYEWAGPTKPYEWAGPDKRCEPGAPCQWAGPAKPYEWAEPAKPCEPGAPCQWVGPAKLKSN